MSDDDNPLSELSADDIARLDEIVEQIGKLVQSYAELRHAHEYATPPIVVAWAVGYEFTSIELERMKAGGRGVIARDGQPLSASLGLGALIVEAFR